MSPCGTLAGGEGNEVTCEREAEAEAVPGDSV